MYAVLPARRTILQRKEAAHCAIPSRQAPEPRPRRRRCFVTVEPARPARPPLRALLHSAPAKKRNNLPAERGVLCASLFPFFPEQCFDTARWKELIAHPERLVQMQRRSARQFPRHRVPTDVQRFRHLADTDIPACHFCPQIYVIDVGIVHLVHLQSNRLRAPYDARLLCSSAIASPSAKAQSCAFCISFMLCIMAASRSIVFRSFFVSILFTSLRCSVSSGTGVCVYIHIIQPPVELVNTFLRKFCDFLC